jgi:hypothetical protein
MPLVQTRPRRKTVIGSGLLCCALTLVVLFTGPGPFRSPAAVVVVAAIGAAAVLFQLRIRNSTQSQSLQSPLWLNVLGILFAVAALFPMALNLGQRLAQTMALASVCSFAISSAIILHSFRKPSAKPE